MMPAGVKAGEQYIPTTMLRFRDATLNLTVPT